MRTRLRLILWLLVLCLFPAVLQARPARTQPFTLTQPDGTTFRARLSGDEYCHLLTSEDGCALIRDGEGFYCYAYFTPDGQRWSSGVPYGLLPVPGSVMRQSRTIPDRALRAKGRIRRMQNVRQSRISARPSATAGPVRLRVPIILAQYPDLKFSCKKEEFERQFNPAYSRGAAAWLHDQLGDAADIQFIVYDTVTVSRNHDWYARSEDRWAQLIADACSALSETVDFSQFDLDGNDEVDVVHVIFAGGDQADGAGEDHLWSHQSYLRDWEKIELQLNGCYVNCYSCSSELDVYRGRNSQMGIGTFCHEFSHTFGLPDLYDTDYELSGGTANALWESGNLMDSGDWNGEGHLPPNYGAIERFLLRERFGLPAGIPLAPGNCVLGSISSGAYYYLEGKTEGEVFLFECRTAEGWDAKIGGSGLAVYHLDRSTEDAGYSSYYKTNLSAQKRWELNEINCRPDRECADWIEADPNAKSISGIFFPQDNRTVFSGDTEPPFRFHDGRKAPYSLTDIRFDGNQVSFTVLEGSHLLPPEVQITRQDLFQDAAILQWTSSREGFSGNAHLRWKKEGDEQWQTLEVEPYETGRYAHTFEGLQPRTDYNVEIWFSDIGVDSPVNKQGSFRTKPFYSNSQPFINFNGIARNDDGSFPAGTLLPLRCHNLEGATAVSWTFNGHSVTPGADGYYHLSGSGTLRAVVTYGNGHKEILQKTLRVK